MRASPSELVLWSRSCPKARSIAPESKWSSFEGVLHQEVRSSVQKDLDMLKNSKECGWPVVGLEEAIISLEEKHPSPPSIEDIRVLLQRCRHAKDRSYALRLQSYLQKHQMDGHAVLGNRLVSVLVDLGCTDRAQESFDKVIDRNARSWNSLIRGYLKYGKPQKAFALYKRMREDSSAHLDIDTLVALVKACASLKDLERGALMHEKARELGVEKDLFAGSTLVDMYAKCGMLSKAQKVFDELRVRNVVSWTALISGYAEHGCGKEALDRFETMQSLGIFPNSVTFVCALKACGTIQDMDKGLELHAEIERQGLLGRNLFIGSALVDMYVKCCSLASAENVFNKLLVRNAVSWNALISGYSDDGRNEEVLMCFEHMRLEGIHPDGVTFACILKACAQIRDSNKGQEVHGDIREWGGLERDPYVGNALVSMYAKCGMLTKAQEVFDELRVQDVVTWTALIDGYTEHGLGEEGLKCFEDMQSRGISPNIVTFICSLKACGVVGAERKGEEIHGEIERRGLLGANLVVSTLIDMYAKCGSLAKAQQVFDKLPAKNVVSWTSLMSGYVQVGEYENVFRAFDKMLGEGVKPNLITFVVVLHACSQRGLVSESQTYFEAMRKEYGIAPVVEHHTCVVDLLGRSGDLAMAAALVEKRSRHADLALWHTLLCACKSCGNLELGKHAFGMTESCREGSMVES